MIYIKFTDKVGDFVDKSTILIIEDERKLSRVIQLELQYENYETEIAENGKEALHLLETEKWDLVLLDIMIPHLSGLEVLRRFRRINVYTPVILLTARDAVHDKVSGLDLGANDYITKPFQIEELLARIRAQLRTTERQVSTSEKLIIGDLTVEMETREVKRAQTIIELTP